MFTEGVLVDGSWQLSITITDFELERVLRVRGDLHIGGVMLQLVEALGITNDWSDYGLWWPDKNQWLLRTRSTLDQYGVQADAQLWFTPMHKQLHVQLPDLQTHELSVNFSIDVFSAVINICKQLEIRHPEELSLCRKLNRDELRKNRAVTPSRKTPATPSSPNLSTNGSLAPSPRFKHSSPHTPTSTMLRTPSASPFPTDGASTPHSPGISLMTPTRSPGSMHSLTMDGHLETSLINSPTTPNREAMMLLHRPRSLTEKARINAGWLDSGISLMEQGIREDATLLLRFKYFNFYDLNQKTDSVRVNQLYAQAKWALLSEEIECTEEEMMMFAALQLQIQIQANVPQPYSNDLNLTSEDDIDAALNDLQISLEGSDGSPNSGDITRVPELQSYLRFYKPKKFALKSYKRFFFVFRDTHLSMYPSREEVNGNPAMLVNLRGCEVTPEVNIPAAKYNIRLYIPSASGITEFWLRADSESQYARWMAACKLASKGKTMADSSYEVEVTSITSFLSMQHPATHPALNPGQIENFNPEELVSHRYLKKLKSKQLMSRVLEAHANVQNMTLLEAKMNFIRAWQSLPDYGVTLFIVHFKGAKKDELLGVTPTRLMRMDLLSGAVTKSWRFSSMSTWSVNWEVKQLQITFEDEKVAFECLSADCKVAHEFVGGYVFLATRSADRNQTLNVEEFHRLTGGWS